MAKTRKPKQITTLEVERRKRKALLVKKLSKQDIENKENLPNNHYKIIYQLPKHEQQRKTYKKRLSACLVLANIEPEKVDFYTKQLEDMIQFIKVKNQQIIDKSKQNCKLVEEQLMNSQTQVQNQEKPNVQNPEQINVQSLAQELNIWKDNYQQLHSKFEKISSRFHQLTQEIKTNKNFAAIIHFENQIQSLQKELAWSHQNHNTVIQDYQREIMHLNDLMNKIVQENLVCQKHNQFLENILKLTDKKYKANTIFYSENYDLQQNLENEAFKPILTDIQNENLN